MNSKKNTSQQSASREGEEIHHITFICKASNIIQKNKQKILVLDPLLQLQR